MLQSHNAQIFCLFSVLHRIAQSTFRLRSPPPVRYLNKNIFCSPENKQSHWFFRAICHRTRPHFDDICQQIMTKNYRVCKYTVFFCSRIITRQFFKLIIKYHLHSTHFVYSVSILNSYFIHLFSYYKHIYAFLQYYALCSTIFLKIIHLTNRLIIAIKYIW